MLQMIRCNLGFSVAPESSKKKINCFESEKIPKPTCPLDLVTEMTLAMRNVRLHSFKKNTCLQFEKNQTPINSGFENHQLPEQWNEEKFTDALLAHTRGKTHS